MAAENGEQEQEVLLYKEMVESFYKKNYELIDVGKFWVWFNQLLLDSPKDIVDLDNEEKELFLKRLNEIACSFFSAQSKNLPS